MKRREIGIRKLQKNGKITKSNPGEKIKTNYWRHRQVNESDLDKTSRPQSEAVEPREQRDSVLCQMVSLSPSAQRALSLALSLQTFISPPHFSFTYFYLRLFATVRIIMSSLSLSAII